MSTAPSDPPSTDVTAAVLIIGNEILSGRTQDTNLNWIAARLTAHGIRLAEARVVPDVEDEIVAAVQVLSARYSYVFTTGGIGPTHDDITAEAIAKAFGRPVIVDPEAAARLERHYGAGKVTPARLRMARVPEGASLVDNPVSAAPGFRIGNVFVMAGVPAIMRAMVDGIVPTLAGGPLVLTRSIACQIAESVLAEPLGAIQALHPDVDIGSYPWFRAGTFGVSLVSRGPDAAMLDGVADEISQMVRDLGGEPVAEDQA
jgi:molybdenum cofactor synthesis domain-containing protein